jgi:hypothetical protein
MIVAEIEIPPIGNQEQAESHFKLIHCVLNMIDTIAAIKMTPTVLNKCEKNRKK